MREQFASQRHAPLHPPANPHCSNQHNYTIKVQLTLHTMSFLVVQSFIDDTVCNALCVFSTCSLLLHCRRRRRKVVLAYKLCKSIRFSIIMNFMCDIYIGKWQLSLSPTPVKMTMWKQGQYVDVFALCIGRSQAFPVTFALHDQIIAWTEPLYCLCCKQGRPGNEAKAE